MKKTGKSHLILNGNIKKTLLILSFPIMLSNLIQTIYNLTDTYYVSLIGETQVAAIGIVWPVIFFMLALGMGACIAGTALVSQYIGAGKYESAKDIAGQVLTFSFLTGIVIGLAGYALSPAIVSALGAEGLIHQEATDYLRIILAGGPFAFLFFAYTSIKHGEGDTVRPMIISSISVALNIILDHLFIIEFNMGIKGAAYATITARIIFAIIAVMTLFSPKATRLDLSLHSLKLKRDVVFKILKIGAPSSFGQSMSALGFSIMTFFVLSYGENTVTAFTIGNRINSLVLMPCMGFGNAASSMVGQNLGADNVKRARQVFWNGLLLSGLFSLVGIIIMSVWGKNMVSVFTNSEEVIALGRDYLMLINYSMPLMSLFQMLNGVFLGSGHTKYAMILMMGRLMALRVPMIAFFKYVLLWDANAIWYPMLYSNVIINILGLYFFLAGKWENKVIMRQETVLDCPIKKREITS